MVKSCFFDEIVLPFFPYFCFGYQKLVYEKKNLLNVLGKT